MLSWALQMDVFIGIASTTLSADFADLGWSMRGRTTGAYRSK